MSKPTQIFDRVLLRQRRLRAASENVGQDYLLKHVTNDLVDRLGAVNRTFKSSLDLGCHHGVLGSAIHKLPSVGDIVSLDSCEELIWHAQRPKLVADEETLPFADKSFDLIFSGLVLQWVNDLPGCLIQLRRCLQADGLFIAALLGGDSLIELRNSFFNAEEELYGGASPRVAPFGDVRDFGNLLQRAGFALPVTDRDIVKVRYPSALELMKEIKAMGASNMLQARQKKFVSRRLIQRVNEIYQQKYSDDDERIYATFEIIYLMGWAPHPNQQKPLRPGSGKVHLSEIFEK